MHKLRARQRLPCDDIRKEMKLITAAAKAAAANINLHKMEVYYYGKSRRK